MNVNDLGKMTVFGVDDKTYEELLEIAKQEGKSVVDVTSEALKHHISNKKTLKESKEKRLLCEG